MNTEPDMSAPFVTREITGIGAVEGHTGDTYVVRVRSASDTRSRDLAAAGASAAVPQEVAQRRLHVVVLNGLTEAIMAALTFLKESARIVAKLPRGNGKTIRRDSALITQLAAAPVLRDAQPHARFIETEAFPT